jgi:phosphate-selective porin OprO/OprP
MSIARVAYLGIPHTRINVGIIEPAFGLEAASSSGQLMFLERPEIENISTGNFGGGDTRRGIEVAYQYENAFLPGDNFILTAAFTGGTTGKPSATSYTGHGNGGDEQTQILSHLSYRFWSDGPSNAIIGFDYANILNNGGGVYSLGFSDRPEIRVDGTSLISATIGSSATTNYVHHALLLGGNAAANYENFYLGGEYIYIKTDRYFATTGYKDHPNFSGYFAEASWVLTGEPKGYAVNATNNEIGGFGAPKVANPFSLDGDSWGALELAVRYSFTNLDWYRGTATYGIAGGRQGIVDLGLNWYLNNEVKLQFHDSIVHVNKQASVGSTAAATTQVGQDLNIIGIRLQFSN